MESVMNFLADYYIWFFVAAGVLCFALIGFIIESRKKQKNEFKGESIEESTTTNVENTVQVDSFNKPTEPMVEPKEVPVTYNSAPEISSSNLASVSEETMEINDIPLQTEPMKESKPIEFYSGPIEVPTPAPAPNPMPVEDINPSYSNNIDTIGTVLNNNTDTMSSELNNNTGFNTTSYMEEVKPLDNSNMFNVNNETDYTEKKEETESVNIFNDMK